jgi:transposase
MVQRKGAYAPEFRQQIVDLVGAGRKPRDLAKEFGCHETSIASWLRDARAADMGSGFGDAPLTTDERDELKRLRRENAKLKQERDILAKATAWFANKDSGVDKTSLS